MIPKSQKTNENVAGVEGLEPPTHGLEIRCSIHLSYTPSPECVNDDNKA